MESKGMRWRPIDWNPESKTYGKELATREKNLNEEIKLSENKIEIPKSVPSDYAGEHITPEKIRNDPSNLAQALIDNPDYRNAYEDMEDTGDKMLFISKVVKGQDPIDAAREVFEARARRSQELVPTLEIPVGETGYVEIAPNNTEEINRELEDSFIQHRKNVLDTFGGTE